MASLCPLVVALVFGLLPELEAMRNPPIRGEFTFPKDRPVLKTKDGASTDKGGSAGWSMDWFQENYEKLATWDKNPWKTKRIGFGDHYTDLLWSENPADQAKAKEIRRLSEALHQRLLERYPELAVPDRKVPPERNGFLKFLELSERFDADPKRPGTRKCKGIGFPDEFDKQLTGQAPWNADAVRRWLAGEKLLMDEIRAIGLMTEQSTAGIEIDRWAFISARLAKSCTDALLMEARLAAEEGDVARALESVQAANGLANHIGNVESPSLLAVTVQILVQMQTQKYALTEIIPALPAGKLDPAAWENVLNPVASPPGEFARIMKGEWNAVVREYLLPMVCDTEDPKYPPDPEALLDFYSGGFLDVVQDHEGRPLSDLPSIQVSSVFPDNSHLSRQSRQLTEMLFIGARAWRKGWDRTQSAAAMTQAAFAIMKGQPLPNDPIYGQPYRWNPATRELSPPDSPAFKELELKPITVPKP
jgi:hypothetical protein